MAGEKTTAALLGLGYKMWERDDDRRIYIDAADIPELYGLRVERYKTGNVRTATLDGKGISNGYAHELLAQLSAGSFWFDCVKAHWTCRRMSDTDFRRILAGIRARIAEYRASNPE